MNVLSGILAVAAFGFGATSVYLYSELDAARSEAVSRANPCWGEQAQIAVLQQSCVELETMQGKGLPADDPEDDSVQAVIARLQPDTRESRLDAPDFQATRPGRELSRTRHEAILRRMYGGIGEELNLSQDQEAELLALLFEHQTERIETARRFAGDRAAMTSAMNELQSENSTELMAALGDEYLQFEDYQETLGERMQIERAALQLEAAGVPLKEDQERKLLAVMVEEQDQMPRPVWSSGMPVHEYAALQRAWQEDYDEHVRERVARVLTSEQLRQYDVHRNLQSTLRSRQAGARYQAGSSSDRRQRSPGPSGQ